MAIDARYIKTCEYKPMLFGLWQKRVPTEYILEEKSGESKTVGVIGLVVVGLLVLLGSIGNI